MSRADAERSEDIHAAIARCMAYRDHLDSAELGEMAYDAILRNLNSPNIHPVIEGECYVAH